jgi:hypothetical protein
MTNHETHYRSGEQRPIELKPNQAREGRKDVPILYVLLWSTALAIIVLAGIWLAFHAVVR